MLNVLALLITLFAHFSVASCQQSRRLAPNYIIREFYDLRDEEEFGEILALSSSQKSEYKDLLDKFFVLSNHSRDKHELEIFRIEKSGLDDAEKQRAKKKLVADHTKAMHDLGLNLQSKIEQVLLKRQLKRVRQLANQRSLMMMHGGDEFESLVYAADLLKISKGERNRLKVGVEVQRKKHLDKAQQILDRFMERALNCLTKEEQNLSEKLVGPLLGHSQMKGRDTVDSIHLRTDYESVSSMRRLIMDFRSKAEVMKEVELDTNQWKHLYQITSEFNKKLLSRKRELKRQNPITKTPQEVTLEDFKLRKKLIGKVYDEYRMSEGAEYVKQVEDALQPPQLKTLKQKVERKRLLRQADLDPIGFFVELVDEISTDEKRKRELREEIQILSAEYKNKKKENEKESVNEILNSLSTVWKDKLREHTGEIRFGMRY